MNPRGHGRMGGVRKAGGWALLAVGLAGCVLPVIPGVPLILAGLLVLAEDYAWARLATRRVKRGFVHMRRRARAKRAAAAAQVMRGATDKRAEEGVGEA